MSRIRQLIVMKSVSNMQSTTRAGGTKNLSHENLSILNQKETTLEMGRISLDAVQHTTEDTSACLINPWLCRSSYTLAEIKYLTEPESTSALSWVFANYNFKKGQKEEACPLL